MQNKSAAVSGDTVWGKVLNSLKTIDTQAPTLTYYGVSFWMVWNTVAFSGSFWLHETANSAIAENLTLVHLIACFVTLILIAILAKKFRQIFVDNRTTLVGAAISVAGSIGIVISNPDISGALLGTVLPESFRTIWFNCSCVLTGVGTTFLFIRAAALFGALPPRKALSRFASCTLVSGAIFFILMGSPTVINNIFFVLLPLISALLFCIRSKGDPEHIVLHASAKTGGSFIAFLVSVALISLTLEAMKSYFLIETPASQNIDIHSLAQLFSIFGSLVLIMVAFFMKDREGGFIRLYSIVTAAVTLVVLLLVVTTSFSRFYTAFSAACTPIFNMIVWSMLAYLVYQSQAEALYIFGAGNAALSFGTILGAVFSMAFQNGYIPEETARIILIVLGFAVLVDVAFVFTEKRLRTLIVPIEEQRLAEDQFGQIDVKKPAAWKSAVAQISQENKLTPREEQVFTGLAKGMTAQQIADEETLSIYTVRAHTRSIYSKLNVHNKTELLELISQQKG